MVEEDLSYKLCRRSLAQNLRTIGIDPEANKQEFYELTFNQIEMILRGSFENGYVAGVISARDIPLIKDLDKSDGVC